LESLEAVGEYVNDYSSVTCGVNISESNFSLEVGPVNEKCNVSVGIMECEHPRDKEERISAWSYQQAR